VDITDLYQIDLVSQFMRPAVDFMEDTTTTTQETATAFTSMIFKDVEEQVVGFLF
jgi:hypothetical protein